MGGAVVVIFLAGLVLPISMLIVAFVIDVLTVAYVTWVLGHDYWGRIKGAGVRALRTAHLLPPRHAH